MPSNVPTPPLASSSDGDEDAELVARVRAGDTDAFEIVFRRHLIPLCAFAYRYVRSRDVAAEVVHDVFLRVWQHRARLNVRRTLRAYLYRATRNRAVDYVRHDDVAARWAEEAARHAAGEQGELVDPLIDEAADALALAAAVERALERLPERCRQVFLLRWREGLGYAAIAASMGTSVKTVENQMNRALRALRAALNP